MIICIYAIQGWYFKRKRTLNRCKEQRLGVTVDFNMKWTEHVQNCIVLFFKTVLFYEIRFLDKSIIRQICMTLCN